MSEAIEAWKKLGEEFNRIDILTAKVEYQKRMETLKIPFHKATFCRSGKTCPLKIIRKSKSNHPEQKQQPRYYRLCSSLDLCNQQTRDKTLARLNR